jgi:hypothetical protein
MKRAGIIVGVFLLILAIGIFFIVNREPKKANEISEEKTVTEEPVEEKTPIKKEKEEPKVIVEEKIVEVEVEKEVEVKVSEIKEIDENKLETPTRKEEIVFLSKKRLLLLDEAPKENHSKNLAYNFILVTSDNKEIKLFVTGVVYEQFEIGDKLKIEYDLFENSNNVEFPVIYRATKLE